MTGRWAITGQMFLAMFFAMLCGCRGPDLVSEEAQTLRSRLELREWQREVDVDLLRACLDHSTSEVRQHAQRSAGRLRWEGAVEALCARLNDRTAASDPQEQAAISFALGQIGSTTAGSTLRACLARSPPLEVRVRALEALGKLAAAPTDPPLDPACLEVLVQGLADAEPRARGEAALALWRRDARAGIPPLIEALAREEHPDARWRMVYALARIDDEATLPALRPLTDDPDPWVQTFAAWGMRLPAHPENVESLAALLKERKSFWTARVQALRSLQELREKHPATRARTREILLAHLFRDPHPLVEEALWDALAAGGGAEDRVLAEAAARGSPQPAAQRAALRAVGRLGSDQAVPFLAERLRATEPWLRVAAVQGLAHGGEAAHAWVQGALADGDDRVREAAVRALVQLATQAATVEVSADVESGATGAAGTTDATETPETPGAAGDGASPARLDAWPVLASCAAEPGQALNVRQAVIEALGAQRPRGWEDALLTIWPAASPAAEWENRILLIQALQATDQGRRLASEVLSTDPSPVVRRVAARALGIEVPSPRFHSAPYGAEDRFPIVRTDALLAGERARIHFETTRGTFVMELDLEAAPLHASSLLHLARTGFFDRLPFHRVVPAFVVQGADPRGNGVGDAGYHLVDEIHPAPFLRGTVGMPRATEFDTGGCQLFITHVPTPHLDGRYTVLGRVVLGMEVIDALQVGDRILKARVQENRFHPAPAGS